MTEHQAPLFAPRADAEEPSFHGEGRKIVIIDGHALAYRSYYAIRELTNSKGRPVNAVFGFLRSLLKIVGEESEHDATVVTFDAPAKTFRHEQFDDYKAGRAPTPEDFPDQLATIQRLVDLLGLHRTEVPGLEADDLIGTIAKRCEARGYDVEILTPDRDMYQLVSDRIHVRGLDKQDRYGPDQVFEKYGVRVDQWTDYRALTGDSSDNIPGARGIGPVSARKLLERYGSLDAILADLDAVEPAGYAEKIRASLTDVQLSRELSCIVTHADIDIDPAAWARHETHDVELAALLRELEFGTILADLGLVGLAFADPDSSAASTDAPTAPPRTVDWDERPSPGVFGYVLDAEGAMGANVIELAAAGEGAVAQTHETDAIRAFLADLERVDAFDAKALCVAARTHGASPAAGDDPILMAYVLDSNNTDADTVIARYLGHQAADSAAERATAASALISMLPKRLAPRQMQVYEDIEQPLQDVLVAMETHGVAVDQDQLRAQSEELGAQIAAIEVRVRDVADDPELNLNSRDQVADLLYDRLGLKAGRKTSTGKRSTAVSVLEKLADDHEVVQDILAYRELGKLKGTYLDPLPKLVHPETGRIHTTFKQTAVATGRLSSVHPNLQNIPVRSEIGRRIRKAFVAPDGAVLIVADYSQIELRILAHVAQEPGLLDAFRSDQDIHSTTAAEIHDVPIEDVSPEMRRVAKTINFGVLYGMSAHRLGRELQIPYADAERFIQAYFERYPHVRRYIDETLAFCRKHGWVETLLGRRRFIPDIDSKNRNTREYAERTAYNMPIQGTAADVMKLAMLRLHPHLAEHDARLILQVHDELVVETPREHVEVVTDAVRDAMRGALDLDVPLAVEIGHGPNWLDAK